MKKIQQPKLARNLVARRNGRLNKLAWVGVALIALVFLPLLLAILWLKPGFALAGLAVAVAPVTLTAEQVEEWEGTLKGLKGYKDLLPELKDLSAIEGGLKYLKGLPAALKAKDEEATKLRADLDVMRRLVAQRRTDSVSLRRPGFVSIGCAEYLGAAFIAGNLKAGRLDVLDSHVRNSLADKSKSILGLEAKAALTTTDVPLPTEYFSEIRELISDFGVVRRKMMPFPIGRGTAKPPRFKTRPSFGSIAMSATFAEKSPQIDFATLESHKIGGIVRVPRELDEQSIVPMGQFLARYGAIEFARAEDTWGFLADGTATYELVVGVVKVARTNNKTLTLAAGKTAPSDVTRNDIRNLRSKINKAGLSGGRSAYYFDSTWEAALRNMNDKDQPDFFQIGPDMTSKIDGYPVVWTDVLTPYGQAAAPDSPLTVFGAMDFWWMGEHGQPRLDFSSDVFFATDELATRFIEEIDFDYQQVDVTAALLTAAT